MRRRGEVRLVANPARRVEADAARGEEGLQVGGQVAGAAVVARHHEGGPLRLGVQQRGQQIRTQALRHEHALRLAALTGGGGKARDGVVLVGV